MKEIKNFWKSLNKIYFCNLALVASLMLVILVNFAVQFKVESLQDRIENMQSEISAYKSEISLLEVEWAYLTRPSRLRSLSEKYLQNNGYTLASQIKGSAEMEKFYQASYSQEISGEQLASSL